MKRSCQICLGILVAIALALLLLAAWPYLDEPTHENWQRIPWPGEGRDR